MSPSKREPTLEEDWETILLEYLKYGKEYTELSKIYPIKTEDKIKPRTIFISLCETEENIYLVEEILDPFLTLLNFDVHYYRKDKKFGKTEDVILQLINYCDIILALYTKEEETNALENVIMS